MRSKSICVGLSADLREILFNLLSRFVPGLGSTTSTEGGGSGCGCGCLVGGLFVFTVPSSKGSKTAKSRISMPLYADELDNKKFQRLAHFFINLAILPSVCASRTTVSLIL